METAPQDSVGRATPDTAGKARPTKFLIAAIALDLGTTSIKAGLLDQHGTLGHIVTLPAPKITVNDGRYESDALAYAATTERVLNACLAQTNSVPPLGLCSQRSSFLIWSKADGQPLTPLISWQDNRGAKSCEDLLANEGQIHKLTGLRLTPYYFAPKLRVVLQEHPQWRSQLERGELLVGTLDTFLIWRWSGGKHHVTDVSMAARTLLMDIRQMQWSPVLCKLFGIPQHILPQINPSAGMNLQLHNGLTLQASVGDQSAALIASVREDGAEALVNLGTGGFVMRYLVVNQVDADSPVGQTHPHPSPPPEREGSGLSPSLRSPLQGEGWGGDGGNLNYLRTLVYQDKKLHAHIALEGTLNSIAAALAPYPANECRVEDLATEDIFCLAEPSGLGAPYFRNDLGICFSRSVDHLSPRQIAGLLLEAIIFRVAKILDDFQHETALERIYLSGGLSELACLQQGIAQCAPCAVYRLQQKDASLQGAALLAAGMSAASNRESKKIEVAADAKLLQNKYRHWQDWFKKLLES